MLRFKDGPAKGKTLNCTRAPIMLRVTETPEGAFDALDQPEDLARSDEKIHVYRLAAAPSFVHVDYRGKGGRRCGRNFQMGVYELLPEQPADEDVRTTAAWCAWCDANKERLMPDWAKGKAE